MSILVANSQLISTELLFHHKHKTPRSVNGGCPISDRRHTTVMFGKRQVRISRSQQTAAFWDDNSRVAEVVAMEEIKDSNQFDQILIESKQLSQLVLIDWMASWCRKCIFLKPKLEKLASEYGPKVKFYCVDVNKVPQSLVKRANISKMPTIQLWKDGEFKEEVIGGHKAWLVIEEVREMIQRFV